MRGPRSALLLSIALLIAPLAAADGGHEGHGAGPLYDPFTPTLTYYLGAAGATSPVAPTASNSTEITAPANGAVHWNFTAARAFTFGSAALSVTALNKGALPLIGIPNSAPFQANITKNGQIVANMSGTASIGNYMPGATPVAFTVPLSGANVTAASGDQIGVALRFTWPQAQSGSLVYLVGSTKAPSVLKVNATLSGKESLGVLHAASATYGWPATAIPAAPANAVSIDVMQMPDSGFEAFQRVVELPPSGFLPITFRFMSHDDEASGQVHEDGTGGLKDPYAVSMDVGGLEFRENLYPAEWVVRQVTFSAAGTYTMKCTAGCDRMDKVEFGVIVVKSAPVVTPPTDPTKQPSTGPTEPTPKPDGDKKTGLPGLEAVAALAALAVVAAVARRRA